MSTPADVLLTEFNRRGVALANIAKAHAERRWADGVPNGTCITCVEPWPCRTYQLATGEEVAW